MVIEPIKETIEKIKRPHLYVQPRRLPADQRRLSRLADRVWQAAPHLTDLDEPAVRAWSAFELVGSEVLRDLLADGVSLTNSDGEKSASPLLESYLRLKKHQLVLERQLGFGVAQQQLDKLRGVEGDQTDLATQIARSRLSAASQDESEVNDE